MPPKKRKRLGRPPNSKNKKTTKKSLETAYLLNRPLYKCNECPKKFKFEKSFIEHLNNNHSKLPGSVTCDVCKVSCPNIVILEEHIEAVHGRDTFECKTCGKKFVRQSHVQRHMSQSGCGGKKISKFPCAICDASFSRKDNLMVHLRLSHIRKKQFSCKQCKYSSQTFNKIIVHTQKKHWGELYVCDVCGAVTKSRAAITKHLEAHGEKKFGCEVCGYITHTIEVMRRHILTHVKEKPYKCSSCGASFIQRKQLVQHLKKHLKTACFLCQKTFTSKKSLVEHLKKKHNQDAGEFSCSLETCSKFMKSYNSEKELQNHLKTHGIKENIEMWACEVCGRQYPSEKMMRKHVVTHTLERPRRCMYCVSARAYVRGNHLVRHVRLKHPNIFRLHLHHVRQVTHKALDIDRVAQSELDAILSVLDAESDRILEGTGPGVLYGGMQEVAEQEPESSPAKSIKMEDAESPLMSEEELVSSLQQLLAQLINADTLECFGWPHQTVDVVLEKVIDQCGANPADSSVWSRVQCLRENTKQLFLHVVEDKNIANMLYTHTIDQIIKHILHQVSDDN